MARACCGIPLKERLIVALDVPSTDDAKAVVAALGMDVRFYKIGMQLLFAGGLEYARVLIDSGRKVFLDAKLFDIEQTIAGAVQSVARMGVTFLTVHGNRRTIQAAVKSRGRSGLKLLSVTVLTSLDAADILDLGFPCSLEALALHRARAALEAGADGVITSGHEAVAIRQLAGDKLMIVMPGIRPDGTPVGDQKRTATPSEAIAAGADYLVVGRPILQAQDRRAAAVAILRDIEAAQRQARPE